MARTFRTLCRNFIQPTESQSTKGAGSYAPPLLLDSIPLGLENSVRGVHSPAACWDDDHISDFPPFQVSGGGIEALG